MPSVQCLFCRLHRQARPVETHLEASASIFYLQLWLAYMRGKAPDDEM